MKHLYELAPITGRSGNFLAKVYGYQSIDDLADSLPVNSQILDVGAGRSTLGQQVTARRKDVSWTNFDLSYNSERVEQFQTAQPNLTLVQGNIITPPREFKSRFDRVYSYWLLPLLALEEPELARQSMENIIQFLKKDGSATIGPLVSHRRINSDEHRSDTTTISWSILPSEIDRITDELTMPENIAWVYRAIWRSGLAFIRRGEQASNAGNGLGLYDTAQEEFVPVFSLEGFRRLGGLASRVLKDPGRNIDGIKVLGGIARALLFSSNSKDEVGPDIHTEVIVEPATKQTLIS
ncbi:hypothetical protein A3F65_02260 [Candidatus Saccharibacteria bacterium RIFCSPHIGHO2_12_FULL_47_16b]|nr:MAG: hypothetical protein A3F65_02260 [Candidatus Saccharibacteria bacterium RIFCSPHIGHO2_12_FULL_47_16b]OGL38936.1 MAG: hypothetical protein A3J32_00220 [Candidatus Saccharibacteria bacterium RIFCSPLOWO2_02_FULL_46_7]